MAEMKNQERNGANRCPHCGATDVKLNIATGKLKCSYCRSEYDDVLANARGGVENLQGRYIGEGATNIIPDEKVIVTLKCPACGAEVVINTDEATSARCHWCRHTLSINEKMPNGAVPDLVLPFKTEKTVAEQNIREFVKKRQFFAHPTFKKEFAPENVMGVYLPYMIVDVNAHASMKGEAEHLIRKYTSGSGNHKTTYYDAEAFAITRDFDLLVDDLTIESSSKRLQQDVRANTNNVINAIMPFDTENCVDWNPNYLHGFASERRDTNVDDLVEQLKLQIGDIARYRVKESMTYYNRGAKWTSEQVEAKGSKWKAAYLPVWLYSYLQVSGDKKMLHYVAVNARTGETMGSVPINKTRLLIISGILEIIGLIMGWYWIRFWLGVDTDDDNPFWLGAAGVTPGFIFYWMKSAKYRNMNARHKHEAETPSEVRNMQKTDVSIGRRNRLRSASIAGRNDSIVKGVVAKSGEHMMGEKMANFIGIGRMVGSKAGDTPIGQMTEAKAQENKKTAKILGRIILLIFLLPFIAFFIMFVFFIIMGAGEYKSKDSEGVGRSVTEVTASFSTLEKDIKSIATSNNYFSSLPVGDMAFYNTDEEYGYSAYKLNSSHYIEGFAVSAIEFSSANLSETEPVTSAGKLLDRKLETKLTVRSTGVYEYTEDKTRLMMRLYADANGDSGTYDFCDLREILTGSVGYSNSYRVTLTCVEIDEASLKANKISF